MDHPEKEKQYFTVVEVAEMLGITRAAVHKQIKAGKISVERIGRAYAIPVKSLPQILRTSVGDERKREIESVVKRVVKEYGHTLRLLGKE